MRKYIAVLLFLFSASFLTGATDLHYVIDAESNAARHNNLGIACLKEKYYFGAIKEFEMAINLNPNTQASAVYYNNLGRTYITIGYPELAEDNFRKALLKYPLCFEYYLNLVEAYGKQNKVEKMLEYHKINRKNSLDDITIALLHGALGRVKTEIIMLDEFCDNEPDLIITPAVKRYIKEQSSLLNTDFKFLQ